MKKIYKLKKKRKINKESTCIAEHDNLHPSWAAKKKTTKYYETRPECR